MSLSLLRWSDLKFLSSRQIQSTNKSIFSSTIYFFMKTCMRFNLSIGKKTKVIIFTLTFKLNWIWNVLRIGFVHLFVDIDIQTVRYTKKKIYKPCRSEGELIDRVWDIKTFGSEGELRKWVLDKENSYFKNTRSKINLIYPQHVYFNCGRIKGICSLNLSWKKKTNYKVNQNYIIIYIYILID